MLQRVVGEAQQHLHDPVAVREHTYVVIGHLDREGHPGLLGKRLHDARDIAEQIGDELSRHPKPQAPRLEPREREQVGDEPAEAVRPRPASFG